MAENMQLAMQITADIQSAHRNLQTLNADINAVSSAAQGSEKSAAGAGAAMGGLSTRAQDAHRNLQTLNADINAVSSAAQGSEKSAAGAGAAMGGLSTRAQEVSRSFRSTRAGLESISAQLQRTETAVTRLAGAWLGIGQLRAIVDMADQYGQMASRIKMATASSTEYEMVQTRLLATAQATFRPLAETQEVYLRTADSLRGLGYTTSQAMDVTDSLSYLFVTNAASADRAAGATQAFAKSLQTGEVNAMAWQTILAAVPSIVDNIAAASGKTGAELEKFREEVRRLGAEGKLALTDLTEGLRRSAEKNLEDVAKMPTTVADAMNNLRTALQDYVGRANSGAVSTETLSKAVNFLAQNIDVVAGAAGAFAALMVGRYVLAMAVAGVAKVNNLRLTRQQAQEELTLAKNAVAAANATSASANVIAAANTRLATAQAAVAAGSVALSGAIKATAAFLTGPLGLAMTVATVAAGWLMFRDNADAAKSSLVDLALPLDETIKKFKALGQAQQAQELANVEAQNRKLRESYQELAEQIEAIGKKGAQRFAGETAAAFRTVQIQAARARQGGVADWNAVADAIQIFGGETQIARDRLTDLTSRAQTMQQEGRSLSTVAGQMGDAMRDAAGEARGLAAGVSLIRVPPTLAADLTKMRQALEDKRDPSAVGKFMRGQVANWMKESVGSPEEVTQAIQEGLAIAQQLDALDATTRKKGGGGGGRKADPYLQQSASLASALAAANQKLADAQNGVDESTRRAQNALALWLNEAGNAKGMTEAQIEALKKQAAAVDAAAVAYDDLQKAKERAAKMAGVEIELLKFDGRSLEAQQKEIAAKYRELTDDLQKRIAGGDAAAQVQLDLVVRLKGLEGAKAELDATLETISKIQERQSRAEQSIEAQVAIGVMTESEGRSKVLQIHREVTAELEKQKPLLEQLAAQPGIVGEQAREVLEKLRIEQAQLLATTTEYEAALKSGINEGLNQAINGLVEGTMSLEDALRSLVHSIAQSMLEVAANNITESATNSLMGLLRGATGGGAGGAGDAASGVALTTAGTTLTTAGAGLTTAAGALTTAAGALTTSAGTKAASNGIASAAASSAGGSGGWMSALMGLFFADGGYTGAGGKYTPAGVVHAGEVVHRQAVVRQPGMLPFLLDINRYGAKAVRAYADAGRLPGFAEGGYVPDLPAPAFDRAALTQGWEPATVETSATIKNHQVFNLIDDPQRQLETMRSPAGAEVLTVQLSRNPAHFRSILGV